MNERTPQESLTETLRRLYIEDQRDRLDGLYKKDPILFDARDKERLSFVLTQIEKHALNTSADRFHAAMILQHGNHPDHFRLAHELALGTARAGYVATDDEADPYWLAAAAYDRWLISTGKLQRYGSQYQRRNGVWHLCEVDPSTTDEERAAAHLPSLAEARAYAETLNQRSRGQETGS